MPTNALSIPRGVDTNSQKVVRDLMKRNGFDVDKFKAKMGQEICLVATDPIYFKDEKAMKLGAGRADVIMKAISVLEKIAGGGDEVPLGKMSDDDLDRIAGFIEEVA